MTKPDRPKLTRRVALWLAEFLRKIALWLDRRTVRPFEDLGPLPSEQLSDSEWEEFAKFMNGDGNEPS